MYNTIRKDVVVNTLRWLKNNNSYYKDIHINDIWADHWQKDELGILIDARVSDDEEISSDEDASGESHVPSDEQGSRKQCETQAEYLDRLQDEKELKEDQMAADKQAKINGQQDPCSLQLDNIEDGIYSVAPGEDNTPKYVLLDKDFEVLAFPDLFPFGTNGFISAEKRYTDLSLRKYYQQRLLNVDGRFAKNIEYLFCAQYAADLRQVQSEANVALRITKGRTLVGNRVNAGMLKRPEILGNLIHTEQAYKFLRHIRGSPAY